MIISLAGNPNSGKSTLFNQLTNKKQRTGNWSGVTVSKKISDLAQNQEIKIVDLPGLYNLQTTNTSIDEMIAIDHLNKNDSDLILNIIDCSNFQRSLHLTLQLIQLKKPVVVVLNMMDRSSKDGITVDPKELSKLLGCPVYQIIANHGFGVEQLIKDIAHKKTLQSSPTINLVNTTDEKKRHKLCKKITGRVVKKTSLNKRNTSDRIDDLLLHKYLGIPVFMAIMLFVFSFSIIAGTYFQDIVASIADYIFVHLPTIFFENIGAHYIFTFLIADSIGAGISLVLQFVPVIGALYLLLSALEETGYITRAAFLLDRFMNSIGMSGKSFLPLVTGFGCNVPSIVATRIIEDKNERITTAMMLPFMSCGARLSVYALFCSAFFINSSGAIVFSLYLIGILAAVFTALILQAAFKRKETSTFFALELPCYNFPRISSVFEKTYLRMKNFALEAGKLIIAMFVILNIATSFDTNFNITNKNDDNSILAITAKSITPVFKPMGISEDNWPAVVGIITGIFAKEAVIGSLGSLYLNKDFNVDIDIDGEEIPQQHQNKIHNSMQSHFDGKIGVYSYLLFILLYFPCIAVFGALAKEFSYKLAIASMAWTTGLAYICAVTFYQTAKLFF